MSTAVKRPKHGGLETRAIGGTELRADGIGDLMALVGYASSYDVLSQDLGGFREIVRRGAFDESIRNNADVKALFNHDANRVLGRTKSGTLALESDARGLKFRCQLDPNNADHRMVYASVKRGDIDECSFAFRVPDGGDVWDESIDEEGNRFVRRQLRNVTLMDVSAVTYPAYNAEGSTAVNARSAGPDYRLNDPWASERARLRALDDAFDNRQDEFHRRMAEVIGREIANNRR